MLLWLALALRIAVPDTATTGPRWVLTRTDPDSKDVVEAWFDLPAPANHTARYVQLELPPSAAMPTWFADHNLPCRGDQSSYSRLWHGIVQATDTALLVCAKGIGHQTTRLVMLVFDSTTASTVRPVASDIITVQSFGFDPPAWALALLTTIAGFATGLGLFLAQKTAERKDRVRDHRATIESELFKRLGLDLTHNRDCVARFVASAPGTQPATLQVTAGPVLVGPSADGSGFFPAQYVERIGSLYEAFRGYNRWVTSFRDAGPGADRTRADAKARKIARALDNAFSRAADADKEPRSLLDSAAALEKFVVSQGRP
jgi:hypothetical protein